MFGLRTSGSSKHKTRSVVWAATKLRVRSIRACKQLDQFATFDLTMQPEARTANDTALAELAQAAPGLRAER